MTTAFSPFHSGEIEAQQRAGVEADAAAGGQFIRNHMPEQHRAFFAALPYLVVASGDDAGQPWVTILEGQQGFVTSPDAAHLSIAARPGPDDPLAAALGPGSAIGLLGIELSTRRRNRLNGTVSANGDGLQIAVRQSFGNCPQYINERGWSRVGRNAEPASRASDRLDAVQMTRIGKADTFFIGSGHAADGRDASDGFDASHRGGRPGFLTINADGSLSFPDFSGNRFFNTLGNIEADGRVGLFIPDFSSGAGIFLTGLATVDWTPDRAARFQGAERIVDVQPEEIWYCDHALPGPAPLASSWPMLAETGVW